MSVTRYFCQILSQLLGISALAAVLSLRTVSITLHLPEPLERCCFQGLFSNTCRALPLYFQRAAGAAEEQELSSQGSSHPLPRALAPGRYPAVPSSTWGLLKHFGREVCCNPPLTGTWHGYETICFANRGLQTQQRSCSPGLPPHWKPRHLSQ